MKAELYRDDEDARPFSTGYAKEVISERGVNRDFALEIAETSAIGVACKNANIGTEKHAISREEAAKVNRVKETEKIIQETKKKMAETAKEYVPVPKEDDPWTIRDAEPAKTIDEAVKMVDQILGLDNDVTPKCSGCETPKPMDWKTGVGKNSKPYGRWSCYVCKDVKWCEIDKNGKWVLQKEYR